MYPQFGPGTGAEKDRPDRLQMDSAAAQLWVIAGVVSSVRADLYVADVSARQRQPAGGTCRLGPTDAEEPGPHECTVHRAVSDIEGATGLAIIRGIVGGERDPAKLAALRDPRCQKSVAEITEHVSGHGRKDHLFSLEQSVRMHDAIEERIQAYEEEILRQLAEMERPEHQGKAPPALPNQNKARMIQKRGEEPMRQAFYRMSGTDLTAIDAVGVGVVQVVLSEYGPDLSCFPTEKHFISHVTLAPRQPVSGGKILKKKRKHGSASSRVASALRSAALSLRHSTTAQEHTSVTFLTASGET